MGIDEARDACADDAYRLVKYIWNGHGGYVLFTPKLLRLAFIFEWVSTKHLLILSWVF